MKDTDNDQKNLQNTAELNGGDIAAATSEREKRSSGRASSGS